MFYTASQISGDNGKVITSVTFTAEANEKKATLVRRAKKALDLSIFKTYTKVEVDGTIVCKLPEHIFLDDFVEIKAVG